MQYLKINRRQAGVTVLGPGNRTVLWVQGCPLACPGCMIPESWDESGGEAVHVQDLTEWILEQRPEGLTLSGGEPMEQASGLVSLIDRVRRSVDIGVVCYTGYTLEYLLSRRRIDQMALLARLDLLIDGPYIQKRHAPLLWRGSCNQRLLPLTDRYRSYLPAPEADCDNSAGLEFSMEPDGSLSFAGVPPVAGFRERFELLMQQRGIALGAKNGESQ